MRIRRRNLVAWSGYLDRASLWLTLIGGLSLLAIVVLVSVGVGMRYVLKTPLLGINEIVQLSAVALVMSALPYCTSRSGHVSVDVFDNMLGWIGRFLGDLMSHGLSLFVFVILAQRATLKALDALEWGDATNMLGLPIWPFYAIIATGAAICALIFAAQILVVLVRGRGHAS